MWKKKLASENGSTFLLNFVQLPMFDKSTLDNKERFRLVIAFSVFPLYKKLISYIKVKIKIEFDNFKIVLDFFIRCSKFTHFEKTDFIPCLMGAFIKVSSVPHLTVSCPSFK